MNYITVRQAAEKWGITMRRVEALVKDSRIDGAIRPGHDWLIRSDAKKPEDGRKNNRRRPKEKGNC